MPTINLFLIEKEMILFNIVYILIFVVVVVVIFFNIFFRVNSRRSIVW
ncbi:MAG: photosystem II reaction center protein T [Ferruginibacter sp.]